MGEEKSLENPQIPKKILPLKDLKNPHFRGKIPIVETLLPSVPNYTVQATFPFDVLRTKQDVDHANKMQ